MKTIDKSIRPLALLGFSPGFGSSGLLVVACFWLGVVQTAISEPLVTKEIVTFKQLKALAQTKVAGGRPVRLRGVVLCYDSGWDQLYIHDGNETGYFHPSAFKIPLAPGQQVEITGATLDDNTLMNLDVTVLGTGNLPAAKQFALVDLARDHGEWVETSGRVLSAETSRGRLALLLHHQGRNCLVYVMGSSPTNDFRRLLDCRVRVRGINASKISDGRLISATVFAPGMDEVTVLEPIGEKPTAPVPVVSISSLLNRELGPWTNHWVRINGLLTSYQPGQSLIVKDPTGVIRAQIIQLTQIRGDERVDVWGFLEVSPTETFLNDAYFEVVRPSTDLISLRPPTSAPNELSEVLTNIADVLKLRRDEAAQHIPVRLRGVLTYADPEWRNGFIQDKGHAIYVDLDSTLKNLQSGQYIEVVGQTSPGGFAPEVIHSTIQVLGATNLPTPARVDLEDLANGHLDSHWVEMEGVVRRVDEQSGHVTLSLMTPKGRFKIILPGFHDTPPPAQLIDALISVQGACTSELNTRRQLSGITLHVPNLNCTKILQPPPADAFAIGITPVDAVATFDPDRLAGRRVKVRGVVTLQTPGQGFVLQDDSGGLRLLTRQTNEVHAGDLVEALGFPAIGDFSPYLEEAAFRQVGNASLPSRKKTTAEQILLHGTNDAQLVEIEARLLQSVPRSANPQLVLQDGPIIFTAHLMPGAGRPEVPALESGSLLRLAGVCSIQGGERHEPETFRLLLRQPNDIELLATPPWWTSRHAVMLAGGMMLAIVVAFAWVALLRRQVRTQTELLRQKLEDEAAIKERYRELFENANDMVYTHDRHGRITSINQTGERLLQRSREEILSHNLSEFVVEEQQAAAREWLDTVVTGAGLQMMEWDFAAASGQRVKVEISTRLIEQGGELVEVEGIARDITERKRLECEILEISNREQRRIGHDLHDGVCQQLAGIAYLSSTLADELQEKGDTQSSQAERISNLINGVINQTRGVARGLFPVRLEENGLVSALEELAGNASELFNINCRFVSEESLTGLENGLALHLYYIVLEAVANAARHGKAKNVTISLETVSGRYLLKVQDNGVGFSRSARSHTGMGIRIMQYRARVVGATLNLQSQPGRGTEVACLFVPILGKLPQFVAPVGSLESAVGRATL